MTQKHIMVCVTGQRTCERLIRQSAAFAKTLGCGVSVIHVASSKSPFMGSAHESEALEYLYQTSKEFGADMNVIRSDDIIGTIAAYAKKTGVNNVVMGGPVATGSWDVPALLKQRLPKAEFYVIPSDVTVSQVNLRPAAEGA